MIKYFKQSSGLASIFIVFEGSNLESPEELGSAHLLEHLVCYKLKKYESLFDLHGIEHNAGTGPTYTQYYIRGLDEKVKKFAQSFYDEIAVNPLKITEKEFEEEKRIIIQEWHDDVSNPESNLMNLFYLKYYKSPRTIGTLKALESLSFKQFKAMYSKYYAKPLYCLVEQSSNWRIKDHAQYKESHDSIFEFNLTTETKPFPRDQGSNPSLLIISDNFQEDFTAHYLINCMMGEGLGSPLFKALREQHQLVYSLNSNLEFVNPYLAHSKFLTSTQSKNKDKVWKVFKAVLKEKEWLTPERLKQCVQRTIVEIEIERRLNMQSPAQEFLNPYEELLKEELPKVKFKKIEQLANNWYHEKNFLFFY